MDTGVGLIKKGIIILFVGCILGVSLSVRAANQAFGSRTINVVGVQHQDQQLQLSLLGWNTTLRLGETQVLRRKAADLITAEIEHLHEQWPEFRAQAEEMIKELGYKWSQQRETAVSFFKGTLEQWENQEPKE